MNMFAPFVVLLFVSNTNAIPDQPYNGNDRYGKDDDLIGDLLDRFGIERPIQRILSTRKDGKIKFIHHGHCAAGSGWLDPNSKQETIDDCLKECKSRAANAKYFAYSSGKQHCACYKTDCTYDGRHMDYMSYEIIQSVKYDEALATMWCKDSQAVEGRNGCMSDEECLGNARFLCDENPNCFGVSWFPPRKEQKLKLCLSREMEPRSNGTWRTMMKTDVCVENTSWKTPKHGYTCADYAKNKWCEQGGKGSAWKEEWIWSTDSNGLDARSACCVCGGSGRSEGLELVNIEDCTKGPRHWHVMDMIKCGQRNDKRLKEKMNELLGIEA